MRSAARHWPAWVTKWADDHLLQDLLRHFGQRHSLARAGREKLRDAVRADGLEEDRVVDDPLLGASRVGPVAIEGSDEDSDLFEGNPEGAQEQVLPAVRGDAARSRKARERGDEKEPALVDLCRDRQGGAHLPGDSP